MIHVERLFPARVVRVHGVARIEVDIDLGFGVHVLRTFSIDGFDGRTVPRALASSAVHALVMLIGGKRVFVCPESTKADARTASLYLRDPVRGTPVGYVADAPGAGGPILDVALFMNWLAEQSFDVQRVRGLVYGSAKEKADGCAS